MTQKTWLAAVCFVGLAWACAGRAAEPPLSEAEFKLLHQQLCQAEGARWDSIPWMVSVQEARRRAAKEKKPILTWAQNGHPLGGC